MTTVSRKPGIAVIGGGWAGCAAALTLAEAGLAVTLFEAGRTLGGRARSVECAGQVLDNGQHILLGAYTQTLSLIQRLHPAAADEVLWRLPLTLRQPPDFSLTCPRLPAPLHLAAGLLGAHGLSWREKLMAAQWAHRLLRDSEPIAPQSVYQLTRNQPARLNRLLWHPLCVSALNTPPEIACAKVFRNVIRAAFGGSNRHSDLVLPRRDLTALFPAPVAARLLDRQGSVQLSSRVNRLESAADSVTVVTRDAAHEFSHAILAVAPQHLGALVAPVPALTALAQTVAAYRYQPIATGYVQYAPSVRLREPMFALGDGPAQFVFDRGQSHGQAGLLAFVASAAAQLTPGWLSQAEAQLQRIMQPGAAVWRQSIVEKQATYACVSGMPRPSVRTPHPRIYLAGDYTAGPYPATLESASLSGVQSARTLLEQL